jgi:hypothetical protein
VASNSSFTSGTVGCPGPFNKWPEKAAAKLGTLAINGGIGGTNTGNSPTFLGPWQTSTAPAYTRFDLTTTVPDFACISLGTNDSQSTGIGSLSNYTSLTQYQTNMLAIISTLNGLGIKRIYATTIPPNGQAAGPLTAAVVAGGSSVTVAQPVGYTTDAPNPWALPGGSTTVAGVYNLASLPTTITLTSTAGFSTTGGFVSLGSLGVISYSGVSGATLTGCTTIVGSGSTVSGTTTAIGSYLAGIELGGAANPLVEGFYVSGVSTAAGVVTLTLGGGRTLANAHAIGVTVMNQAEYNRQQYNAWLRTGCSGLDGVFDLASVVEGPMFTGVAGGGGFAGSVVNGAMLNPYYGQVNSQDLHPSGPGWHAAVAQAFSTFIIGI